MTTKKTKNSNLSWIIFVENQSWWKSRMG